MFDLQFETDNDAFLEPEVEIARILRHAAARIERYGLVDTRFVFDANGNRVGSWIYQEEN